MIRTAVRAVVDGVEEAHDVWFKRRKTAQAVYSSM
jgi:hypothetical protein